MAKKPAATPAEMETLTVERKTRKAENYVILYANDTQVQTTPWDIRLVFGRIGSMPSQADPVLMIEQVGEVSMSPQHAKRVASILQAQIDAYERQVGPIALATDE